MQLPKALKSKLCIPQTHQIPGCQSCHLVTSVNNHDDFGGDQGILQEVIFPLRLRGQFIDSKAKGRLSGKIIEAGNGMELSCNHRLNPEPGILISSLQTSPMPCPPWEAHSECYCSKLNSTTDEVTKNSASVTYLFPYSLIL